MDFLNKTAGKIVVTIVIIIVIIIIYNMYIKEQLDALPDASTMIFGMLPQSKTISRSVAAGGWQH